MTNFLLNDIDALELCHDILDALIRGRSETTPVVVLAGLLGGEGKSVFLKALHAIFEQYVFSITKEAGNFPFLDLLGAKVAFLDDFRFDPNIVSWASLCLWFDGSPLPVGRPQNVQGVTGNMVYKGTAPIFMTAKQEDLTWLESHAKINPATGQPWDADASMIWRRLKVYNFTERVDKPGRNFKFCGRCFARLVRSQAAMWTPPVHP
jgi:hypothetical protein